LALTQPTPEVGGAGGGDDIADKNKDVGQR
jgi:hypothetical protein